jgi:DNA-binding winged helix-turn-helix (wHTH) protein
MTTIDPGYVHISTRTAQHRPSQHRAARGFVLYVGMEGSAASAAGSSLTRLATEMRQYIESKVPGSESTAAVAIAPAGAPGSDLEVVRQLLGDPTIPPGARLDPRHAVPAPVSTGDPGLVIDRSRREVRLDGEDLDLALKEFEILHYLVEHPGRTVGREELLGALWPNADQKPGPRTIDVHIRRLRAKLGRFRGTVHTVHGHGYRVHEHPQVTVWTTPRHYP